MLLTKKRKQFTIEICSQVMCERKSCMDMQKDKNNKRFGIKGVIVSISAVPVLIVGIIITIFAALTMRAGVDDQVFKGLKGIATSAEYA